MYKQILLEKCYKLTTLLKETKTTQYVIIQTSESTQINIALYVLQQSGALS